MKKAFVILATFVIFSVGAYCDTFLMWGGNLGYAKQAGHGGFYHGTFFDTLFYPFDGSIGVGLDLKFQFPIIRYRTHSYLYEHYTNEVIQTYDWGVDFLAAPTLSLKLASFSLKAFPIFAYSIHKDFDFVEVDGQERGNVKEPYIGGGTEICWSGNILETFLTGSYGQLMHTKEKYFSIGFGVRYFLRIKSLRERRLDEERALEEQKKQAEYAALQEKIQEEMRQQAEQKRLQAEQERLEAEKSAIKSGSLEKMRNFLNQYGDSENIRLAMERVLSGNQNQPYRELSYVENPYSFEKGSVYYCSSMEVVQWLSKYSFLAEVNGEIIYVETSNIENVRGRISYAFLKANGVHEYNSVTRLNVVPKFNLVLFDVGNE